MASSITTDRHGNMSFDGPEAVDLFRLVSLKCALSTYARCKMLMTRGLTPTKMLALAGQYTGKRYPRGSYQLAIGDLETLIEARNAAIPKVRSI